MVSGHAAQLLDPLSETLARYELGMTYHTLNRRDELAATIAHLDRYDPKMALHLTNATQPPDAASRGAGDRTAAVP